LRKNTRTRSKNKPAAGSRRDRNQFVKSPKQTPAKILAVGLIAFGLSACFAAGPGYVVHDAPKAVKSSQAAKKAAPAAKMSVRDQVRTRLHGECMSEHGGLFGAEEKIGKQCDCFAGSVVKSMSLDDQEFYSQYGVVPTLSSARPDEVKKTCGIAVIDRSGSRTKPPPPQVY
jgi:hypothetical protein